MLEVALTVVAVASTLSSVLITLLFVKMQSKILDHLKATAQIGGTPVELAQKQTDFEMRKIDESAKQQQRLIDDLKDMTDTRDGRAPLDRGPLS